MGKKKDREGLLPRPVKRQLFLIVPIDVRRIGRRG